MSSAEMLAITAPYHCDPSKYELHTVPSPTITSNTEVLIRIHAASINPVDVKKAEGAFKIAIREQFPYQIGYDAAGVIEAIGDGAKRLKVGDQVYTRLPEAYRGSWSEMAKCEETYVALKPANLSFSDAASVPLACTTALQALKQYSGSLEGKTVLIPAGLSGTGVFACQLAKNVFRAGKVITTVSTSKVPKIPQLLGEGVVDEVIDYTQEDPSLKIPKGSVDFLFDTTGQAMPYLSLMVPKTSCIVSIATRPSGTTLQESNVMRRPDNPHLPWYVKLVLDAADKIRTLRASRWGVTYMYLFMEPNGHDLDLMREYFEQGKLIPVVGTKVDFKDIEKVREVGRMVHQGKGGIGKAVFEIG